MEGHSGPDRRPVAEPRLLAVAGAEQRVLDRLEVRLVGGSRAGDAVDVQRLLVDDLVEQRLAAFAPGTGLIINDGDADLLILSVALIAIS